MVKTILSFLYRGYDWKRHSHDVTDQAKTIQAGDVVECAMETTDGLRYRVEAIDHAANEARIRRLDRDDGELGEAYTLAPVMLRPLQKS